MFIDLGQAIRSARRARGLTQENLADRVGITLRTLGEIERSTRNARLSTVLRIARGLDVELVLRAGRRA